MIDRNVLRRLLPLFTVLVVGGLVVAAVSMLYLRRRLRGPRLNNALDLLEAAYILAVLLAFVGTLVWAAR